MKKIIVIGVIALFVGVGFQSAFAVEPNKLSADNTQIEEVIEPKDYLFETIIEIANNPEVKELFEENNPNIINFDFNNKYVIRQLLFKNPELLFTIVFSKPEMTTHYLEKTYNQGIELINLFGEEKALEMLDSVKLTNTKLLENLNSIIKNDKELSNSIAILSELNDNEIICNILDILFIITFVVYIIFVNIWKLNPDGLIWNIIFNPPTIVSAMLLLIIAYLSLIVFDCNYPPY